MSPNKARNSARPVLASCAPRLRSTVHNVRLPALVVLAALALAGCAATPATHLASTSTGYDTRLGVKSSPRVVADGQPIPKGGGVYMVGRPYAVAGITYVPSEKRYSAVGVASWYGDAFQGRLTANGEVFDKMAVAAAHPTLPLPCYARVTNLANNHSMIVRVNDRGPYAAGRVMDVSERVAQALDFHGSGTSRVRVDYVGKASIDGSDDAKLMATLRTDGTVASLNTGPDLGHSMFADASTPDWPKAPGASARPLRPAQARSQATAVVAQAPADDQPSEHLTVAVRAPLPPTRPFDDGARRQLTALVAATGSAAPVERRTKAASVASAAMPVRRPAEAVLHESDKAGLSKAAAEHPAVRKPKRPEPDSEPQT